MKEINNNSKKYSMNEYENEEIKISYKSLHGIPQKVTYSEKYCLNQYQYEQIKRINKISFGILQDFIDKMYEMFTKVGQYMGSAYRALDEFNYIVFYGKYQYQGINYILELHRDKQVKKYNGNVEIYRYYYKDVWEQIISVVYVTQILMNQTSMFFLTDEGDKHIEKIKKRELKKLKKLQSELDKIIGCNEGDKTELVEQETISNTDKPEVSK